jgi:hypothetical protein
MVLTNDYTHRNSKQLSFLAKSHLVKEEVVYLTLSPSFGFVFYLGSENNHHFVWELLNTNATYIWSLARNIFSRAQALNEVNLVISQIHQCGRNEYKVAYKEQGRQLNFAFHTIDHHLDKTDATAVFESWVTELRAIII